MSSGVNCKCCKTWDDKLKNWEIYQYKCNYSIFNGNRKTPSDYSGLTCKSCGAVWRTKAGYVDKLYYHKIKEVKGE